MSESNPYDSPQAVVADLASDQLAGRLERLGAVIIDAILVLVILIPVMVVGGYWNSAMAGEVGFGTTVLWALIGFGVFAAVQYVPLKARAQTWGKRVLGIRIVDMQGHQPPVGRLLGLRYFPVQMAGNLPFLGPVIGLVNVLLIFRPDRRCGHDLVAGTQVVKSG